MWDSIVGECGQCCGDWCPIRVVAIVKEGSWDRAAFVVKMRKTDHNHYNIIYIIYIYILCQFQNIDEKSWTSPVHCWELGGEAGGGGRRTARTMSPLLPAAPCLLSPVNAKIFWSAPDLLWKKRLFKVNFQSLSTTFTFKIIFAFRIVLVGDASTYPIH